MVGGAEVVEKRYLDPRQTLFQRTVSVSAHHDARLEMSHIHLFYPFGTVDVFSPIAFLRPSCLDGYTLSSFTRRHFGSQSRSSAITTNHNTLYTFTTLPCYLLFGNSLGWQGQGVQLAYTGSLLTYLLGRNTLGEIHPGGAQGRICRYMDAKKRSQLVYLFPLNCS